jgi:tetratricopeptide (TPR) repeat protein
MLLAAGQGAEAENVVAQMIAANPDSLDALLRRAEFRRSRGQWDEALSDCEQAAKVDAKSLLPGVVRASILAARGDYSRAIAETEAVLQGARPSGQLLYAAAAVFSLSAGTADKTASPDAGQQHIQRAVELLAQALGYLDLNYQAVNRILVEPALAPLHRHAKMRELLPVLTHVAE